MSSACLTENEVQALLGGALASARVDRVEVHLDSCLNCQLLVSAGVRTTSLRTNGLEHEHAGRVQLQVGQVVAGRYRITRFIARGGMGEVYAAHDEMLGEEIALKILRPARSGAAALACLRAEVQLARRVSDPHVLRVFDIGSYRLSDDGGGGDAGEVLFLTMQLLAGETLRARIRRAGPIPPAEVWRLAGDMFVALGAAHRMGIVHRDFKSDNVMLVPTADGPPQAVVMDFGLAQAVASDAPSADHDGVPLIVGTLGYMAPEQRSGGAVTAAADVYAFGVVLYEMLTGVLPPFRPHLGRKAADQPAPPPVRFDALDIPARWSALIRRCLAREPAARFRNMIDARQAIASRNAVPRRIGFAAAAAVLLAAPVGAMSWKRAPPAPPVVQTDTFAPPPPSTPPAPSAPVEPVRIAQVATTPKARARSPRRHGNGALVSVKAQSAAVGDSAPGPEPASLERAEALLAEERTAEACAVGETVVAQAPESAATWKFLGGCFMRLGEPVRARRHYRRFLLLSPNDPDSVFIHAIVKQGP
jgi:serine/threonine protein kinase